MPLIRKCKMPNLVLGVWEIREKREELMDLIQLTPAEEERLKSLKPLRQEEWLSSRYLIHVLSGRPERTEIEKDVHGKPFIRSSNHHISVSHSYGYAAAAASVYPVGVDIQKKEQKISRIAHKFVNEQEQSFYQTFEAIDVNHLIWGSKEVMYKIWGQRKIDFRLHLLVDSITSDDNKWILKGVLEKGKVRMLFSITAEMINDYYLIYGYENCRICL